MSSPLSWGGRFRELVAGLVVIPASLLLVQGCAAPQGPPVQLANDPSFKVMSFGDFVGESVSEEYRLLALEVAIPAKYEMTTLADDAYWFPPERAAAVVESGDLPTDTGYFYSKVSLNVGYDAERKIFVGFEDRDPTAEMRQQGIEDFEWSAPLSATIRRSSLAFEIRAPKEPSMPRTSCPKKGVGFSPSPTCHPMAIRPRERTSGRRSGPPWRAKPDLRREPPTASWRTGR